MTPKKKIRKKRVKTFWVRYMKYGPIDGHARSNSLSVKATSEKEAFAKARKRMRAIDDRTGSLAIKDSERITY